VRIEREGHGARGWRTLFPLDAELNLPGELYSFGVRRRPGKGPRPKRPRPEAGLPIATGVIEGACRHLVRDRMEITGARWNLSGAEAILRLRSLKASGDLDEYWRHHEQMERARNHEALYANGEPPKITQPKPASRRGGRPPHLRIVE
jgi:hypothetical protein